MGKYERKEKYESKDMKGWNDMDGTIRKEGKRYGARVKKICGDGGKGDGER